MNTTYSKIIDWFTTEDKEIFIWLVRFLSVGVLCLYSGLDVPYAWAGYVLVFIVLCWPYVVNKPWFWSVLLLLQSVDLYFSWLSKANHGWVMWYWCIAMFIAVIQSDKKIEFQVIQNSARWLLIIVMLAAVYYKGISPEYMNGDFFEFNLASNMNMVPFVAIISDLSYSELISNARATSDVVGELRTENTELKTSWVLHYIAIVTTWWVLLIELVIGALLLFYKKIADWWAHVMHAWFIVGAYAAAPIVGFGWILIVLGYALAWDQSKSIRQMYFALAILMLIYTLPRHELFNYVAQVLGVSV